MNKLDESKLIAHLQDPNTIREQAGRLLSLAKNNQLNHFIFHPNNLPAAADYVIGIMKTNYPDLNIPYHSRWRHFNIGGLDRIKILKQQCIPDSIISWGKMLYELVIISVLLDAGAGNYWSFKDLHNNLHYSRSEGLALASLSLYQSGALSQNPKDPYRIDGQRLVNLTKEELSLCMQITPMNPLDGLDGRVSLLNRLGQTILQNPNYFGTEGRLGNFYSYIYSLKHNYSLSAVSLLKAVLKAFGPIWPQRTAINGIYLGDVWPHQALKTEDLGSEFIPFHKLSQWLTYSLIEPLEEAGIQVKDIEQLTGLPEYRNGGLLIDTGVLTLRHANDMIIPHDPSSELVIEWRGLTVALLDELANLIRDQLQVDDTELPLAKILQGGTWDAGRQIARKLRPNGVPPIQIISDGTIF